jgi:hypothetical protein
LTLAFNGFSIKTVKQDSHENPRKTVGRLPIVRAGQPTYPAGELGSAAAFEQGEQLVTALGHAMAQGQRSIDAARRRVGKSARARLRWLLDFSALSARYARLGIRERARITAELYAFALAGMGSMRRSLEPLSREELSRLATTLREGLNSLVAGNPFDLPVAPSLRRRLLPSFLTLRDRGDIELARRHRLGKNPRSIYDGPLSDMALWAAADLACIEGWRLARCSFAGCPHGLFVRARRNQDYCSAACSQHERDRRHQERVREVAEGRNLSYRAAARVMRAHRKG